MSRNLQAEVRKGSNISVCGLTFYPILMENYVEFISCKDALVLRQGTLPAKYLAYDFLSATFAYEMDLAKEGKSLGLFERIVRLLYLSLRIGYDREQIGKSILSKDGVLSSLTIKQLGNIKQITPREFSEFIRPVIAAQNGLELPNEEDNAEIIEAAEQKKAIESKARFDYRIEDLIASVAYQSRITESEINSWTVREFENRKRAIDRDKRYMLYGAAELGGMVTFKKGNPAPSWCYDVLDDTYGTVALDDLAKTLDGVAEQK